MHGPRVCAPLRPLRLSGEVLALVLLLCGCRSGLSVVGPNGAHVQTEHFDFYTDAGSEAAADTARFAELVYPEYVRLFGRAPSKRTNVYLFDSTELFTDYSNQEEVWARGYYRHARNEIILTRRTVGQEMLEDAVRSKLAGLTPEPIDLDPNPEDLDVKETLLHELTHHFMDLHEKELPPWANEGLAEVVGRARLEGGRLVLGAPQRISLANLQAGTVPLRLRDLLELEDDEFYEGASPYAEAWALAAFLHGKAGRTEDLGGVLGTLDAVKRRSDLDTLETEWRAWIRATPTTDGIEAELASPDPLAVREAIQALSLLLTMGAIPEADRARLCALALSHPREDATASLRELIQALDREGITSPELLAAADALLLNADGSIRAAAAAYVADRVKDSPERLRVFRTLLADPEPRVRAAVIPGLFEARQEIDRGHLAVMTKDPSPRVRSLALQSLDLWDAEAAVFEEALHDPEWEVQLHAAIALSRRARADGREHVARLAGDRDTGPRLFVAASIAHLPMEQARELWERLGKDAHPTVRSMAQRRWAERGTAERKEALGKALADASDEARVAALDMLVEERVPELDGVVVSMLFDKSAWVRTRAARMSGQWKLEAAREGLVRLLDEDPTVLRHEAAVALAAIGDRSGYPVLIDELDSDDWVDQRRGIVALAKLTGQTLDFHWAAPEDRRDEAVERWEEWWKRGGR